MTPHVMQCLSLPAPLSEVLRLRHSYFVRPLPSTNTEYAERHTSRHAHTQGSCLLILLSREHGLKGSGNDVQHFYYIFIIASAQTKTRVAKVCF